MHDYENTKITHILTMNNNERVIIYFKLAYSSRSFSIKMKKHIDMEDFKKKIRRYVKMEFLMNKFELIDADYRRRHPEYTGINDEAPPQSLEEVFSNIFIHTPENNSISFYVKKMGSDAHFTAPVETVEVECMICYANFRRPRSFHQNPFNCTHTFCNECANNCEIHSIVRCPICRNPRL